MDKYNWLRYEHLIQRIICNRLPRTI